MHFSRARQPSKEGVNLGDATVRPAVDGRFLGVWLDRKLLWGAHVREVKGKMATQRLAFTKLAACTWGLGLFKTR